MTLPAGACLGPYEILGPLGAGGMGEVYRARDTRLGREVAIKVLPAALASDPERLKRFEREARAASSLNHPNIVTIHDIGSSDSVSYIAMELVNGSSLRAAMLEGPLPVRQLLQIAVQVADGLAKAHASAIVHRDLKPENVMVTEDGHVKILDFGLAKLTQREPEDSEETKSPTVSAGTEPGVVMGTIGYMSPEQAVGQALDFRSDQFSFGSILYEMATGRRAFHRGSAPQTLTAIIQDEPEPIAELNPRVPAPVRWIVERCLAKKPRNRYASTEDLARELATVRDHLSEATSAIGMLAAEPVRPSRRRRWWIPGAIASAILLTLAVVGWRLRQRDYFWKNPLAGARFTRLTDWEGLEFDAGISADGRFVSFFADRDGRYDAWVVQVGGGDFVNVTKGRYPELGNNLVRNVGLTGDAAHVWLRGGKAADMAGRNVWLVPTMGGLPRAFLPNAVEVVWSPDRSRIAYYTFEPGDPIFVAEPNGANARRIFIDKAGSHNHYLTWSPDGRFIYFARGIPETDMDVWRISPAGGTPERLTHHHARVAYPALLDKRTLIYSASAPDDSGSALYAMDVERRIPHVVTTGVEEYFSVSSNADGRRLVATAATPVRSLWTAPIEDRIVDDAGVTRFNLPTVRAADPRFGPEYVLYLSSRGGPNGLWKWKDGAESELWKGSGGGAAAAPAVSPDGTQICLLIRREGHVRLLLMASDGFNSRPIAETLDVRDAPSWSPDGKWIAVVAHDVKMDALVKIPVVGGPPVRLAEGLPGTLDNPVWSPDGRFILYVETQGGPTGLLRGVTPDKRPFPVPEIPPVLLWGDRYRFLPDGKSLVLMLGAMWRQNFWFLDLASGRMRQLTNMKPGSYLRSFDVSPDGKQVLFDRYRENSDIVLIDLPPH